MMLLTIVILPLHPRDRPRACRGRNPDHCTGHRTAKVMPIDATNVFGIRVITSPPAAGNVIRFLLGCPWLPGVPPREQDDIARAPAERGEGSRRSVSATYSAR